MDYQEIKLLSPKEAFKLANPEKLARLINSVFISESEEKEISENPILSGASSFIFHSLNKENKNAFYDIKSFKFKIKYKDKRHLSFILSKADFFTLLGEHIIENIDEISQKKDFLYSLSMNWDEFGLGDSDVPLSEYPFNESFDELVLGLDDDHEKIKETYLLIADFILYSKKDQEMMQARHMKEEETDIPPPFM